MNKVSINLLPREILLERAHSSKFTLINNISIAVLVLVILLTSAVLLLKISQNKGVENINSQVKTAEGNVIALRSKEETLFALKNRLNSIQALIGGRDENVTGIFNSIITLIPPDVDLYEVTVDKNGTMTASFVSRSLPAIESLFRNLSDKEKNSNLVTKVDLDGISLGRDSTYRFALKISSTKQK